MSETFAYDVFLGHSSKDKPAVRELAERLKGDGLRVWLDEWVIQPGDSIPLAIEQGLESSRTLVLVMSRNAFASEWVTLERHTALFRDPTNQQRRFIPLRLDDAPIRDSIRQFAYVDWRDKSRWQYDRLIRACKAAGLGSIDTQQEHHFDSVRVVVGHSDAVESVAIGRHGHTAVSGSMDRTIRVWDLTHKSCERTLRGHTGGVLGVAITPNEERVISGSQDTTVRLWNLQTGESQHVMRGHSGPVVSVAASDSIIVSGSYDRTLRLWDLQSGNCIAVLTGHLRSVIGVAITAHGTRAVSCSRDGSVRVWELDSRKCVRSFDSRFDDYDTPNVIKRVAVTPDEQRAVSGFRDGTVRVWDLDDGRVIGILEGHTTSVMSTAVNCDGRFAVSSSADGTIRVWSILSGDSVVVRRGQFADATSIAVSDNGQRIIAGSADGSVRLLDVTSHSGTVHDFFEIVNVRGKDLVSRYTKAKVLLVGDSGVGKSGLALRLTENTFEPTVSTDAHWASQLQLLYDPRAGEIDREIWLWDFAGQADYRLIHQLFMDETALAVLVFNPQNENPFEGLGQWDRDLARAARREFQKLLVAGRCDRGGLMVPRESACEFVRERGFAKYLETSALTGYGCEQLRQAIIDRIDWESIPWTASPRIFKLLKDEMLRLRDEGVVLLRMGELKQQLELRLSVGSASATIDNGEGDDCVGAAHPTTFTLEELRAVVGLLAGPGIVWQLEFGDFVLLKPEWINIYAAAVIRSVRAHVGEIGVIPEEDVLAGRLNYTVDWRSGASSRDSGHLRSEDVARSGDRPQRGGDRPQRGEDSAEEMRRLPPDEEVIVLRAMHQTFVDHGLCLREHTEAGTQLVFPSYFRRELPRDPGHPPVLVSYRFNGNANDIYATLVVQLRHTKAFENDRLWRYAADFMSPAAKRMGLKMTKEEEGAAEISVYFEPPIPEDTKVTFIKYVHEHLLAKAQDVVRLRCYVCPHCGTAVENQRTVQRRLEQGKKDILCVDCEKRVPLWDLIEQKFASEEFQKRVRELEELAKAAIDNESRELILIGHAFAIAGEAGQIFRPTPNSDWGIDGEIEFKDYNGNASGQRVYLQLKSGDSYLQERRSDGTEVFRIKKPRWADYWQQQAYPVMLVIRKSDGTIRWMDVSAYLKEKSKGRKTPVKQIVFKGERFTALNLQRMRDRLIPPAG